VNVDHSGPQAILVVGGQRYTMDDIRRLAAGMPAEVRARVEQSCAGQEFAHTLISGGLVEDGDT
jgi:hypothetical protein